MREQRHSTSSVTVFFSYAHADEPLRNELEKHLSLLQRRGVITTWYDRQIVAGADLAQTIDAHLKEATIILLLISPDFMASDYCYSKEMQFALKRHEQGRAHVIPILLRPVDWQDAPFSHLQCLPSSKRPVTLWESQDAAFLDVVSGIRAVIARICGTVTQSAYRPSISTGQQNRQRLLKRVHALWIHGMLEQSLHQAALIALGLQHQPDALANPWRLIVQEVEQTTRSLPVGTHITHVYDEADGELLILGEPGSGKTTLLLALARDLLERAEHDESYPMPVVFNLSSWAEKQQPLTDWLAEELKLRYQVPSPLALSWVSTDRILPLLDGLDEVALTHRVACLEAINIYKGEHDLVPLVVCSRSKEYFSQKTRVLLHNAVTVQPLTIQQIDEYLRSAGEQLIALHTLIHEDEVLLKLATNPLILSVLTLTYHGKTVEELTITGPPNARRRQIFAAYVQRMFEHRGAAIHYTPQQTINWLGWLASQMALHNQTEFYLESMQPDWLWSKRLRRFYEWTVEYSMDYLLCALLHAVYSGLLAVLVAILMTIIFVGTSKEVLGAFLGIFPAGVLVSLVSGIVYGRRKGWFTAAIGIPTGLLLGALISKITSGLTNPTIGLIVGLVTGGVIGLFATLIGGKEFSSATIVTRPLLHWSWEDVRRRFKEKGKGKISRAEFMIGGIGTVLVGAVVTVERGILSGLGIGGATLLAGLLLIALEGGLHNTSLSKHVQIAPNQGIRLSARNGLFFSLAIGLYAYIGTWFVVSSIAGTTLGWMCGLITGVLCGIIGGCVGGWDACMRHLMLRVLLWHAGSLPRNYAHFLDYAAERILLRKIGGGYIFIHRLLLEYFALLSMETEAIQMANLDTKDATIYHNRGLIFAQFREDDQAIENYTYAIERNPKEASVYQDRGLVYTRRKEYQQAIADYTSAIDLEPKNTWTYRQRGLVYHKVKEYEAAIADLSRAIDLAPQKGEFYQDRGHIYVSTKEYEKAIADFTHAIELDVTYESAYFHRGYVYLWLRKHESAYADFVQCAALRPNSILAAWMVISSNLGKQRPDAEIIESLEKMGALAPQSFLAQLCKSIVPGLRHDYIESITQLERLIRLAKSVQEDTYFWKGLFHAYLGQDAEATQALIQSLEAGLPPVLLTPLYWLEQERPEMYQSVAVPFLVQYDI